ncbi:hypothetical protein FGF1_21870 [Flavobacteriaceae bacterium GF1]
MEKWANDNFILVALISGIGAPDDQEECSNPKQNNTTSVKFPKEMIFTGSLQGSAFKPFVISNTGN